MTFVMENNAAKMMVSVIGIQTKKSWCSYHLHSKPEAKTLICSWRPVTLVLKQWLIAPASAVILSRLFQVWVISPFKVGM